MKNLKRKLILLPSLYGFFFFCFWAVWYLSFSGNKLYKNFEMPFFIFMMLSFLIWAYCFCAIYYYLGRVAEEFNESKVLWQVGIAIIPAIGPILISIIALKQVSKKVRKVSTKKSSSLEI